MELLYIFGALALYFLPAIIAWNKKSRTGIFLLNLLLGWTLLGWIAALIWSVTSEPYQSGWIYTCTRCGYKNELAAKVRIHVCPQCGNETNYS